MLLALGFIALAVGQTIASWSADLVEGRRRVRVFIVSAAALYGGMNAMLQIAISSNGASEVANAVNSAVLALIVAAISYAMMRVDGAELFPGTSGCCRKRSGRGAGAGRSGPKAGRRADAADGG